MFSESFCQLAELKLSEHLAAAGFKRTSNWLLLGQPPSQFLLFHRLLLHLSPFLPVTSPVLLVQHCQRLLECLVFASHRLHKIHQERAEKMGNV